MKDPMKASELKSTATKIKTPAVCPNSGIRELQDSTSGVLQSEQQRENRLIKWLGHRGPWDSSTDLTFTSPESWKEERWSRVKEVFQNTTDRISPNVATDTNLQVQEAEQTQTGWTERSTPKHIAVTLLKSKTKKKFSKAVREKHLTYRKEIIRMTVDFSSETMEVRRKRHTFFKCWKKKNCQPRILYPVKTSFRNEGKILRWRTDTSRMSPADLLP